MDNFSLLYLFGLIDIFIYKHGPELNRWMKFFLNASRHADVKATTITAKTKAEKIAALKAEREAILAELQGMQVRPNFHFVS